jgi:uncharacterized cupin superfamily protein
MGYHVVDPSGLSPAPDRPCEKRSISDAAGLSELGCHRYEADPGEQIPLAYHVHEQQEEVFYVLDGTLSVETPEGTYEVAAGRRSSSNRGAHSGRTTTPTPTGRSGRSSWARQRSTT